LAGDTNSYSGGSAIQVDTAVSYQPGPGDSIASTGGYDHDFQVDLTAAAPEPSTWAMLIGGVLLLIAVQRRRSQS
jgi:hypothetical protein